ncbi:DUF5958 family protein [Dactylosporangium sp. CA-052675]|uniref:DUF5958 family protein n=1 Tax=Dactylosporangium sp. CA-052675 TaxID=3239927 RepID=UPI003D922943
MDDVSIKLNRLAQGLDPLNDGVGWFHELALDDRRSMLRKLAVMVGQAHPRAEEIDAAVARSGIRPGATPVVLLRQRGLGAVMAALAALPALELGRGFRLLMLLLGIADGRRRNEECKGDCLHWWHQLSADSAAAAVLLHRPGPPAADQPAPPPNALA